MPTSFFCVPSRWEKSGWKYTQIDLKDQKYFNHPNKINSGELQADDPRRGSLKCESFPHSGNRSSIGGDSETTYDQYFNVPK